MINIVVFFGGTSVEHEVSIITASQAMDQLKTMPGYAVLPVYISKKGDFYSGDALFDIEEFRDIDRLLPKLSVCSFSRASMPGTANILIGTSTRRMDIAFPIVHGTGGEDGTLQGMFEMLDIPYVGCSPIAAAATMDKVATKAMLASRGILCAKDVHFYSYDWIYGNRNAFLEEIFSALRPPYIVKPADVGSSVGVSSVEDDTRDGLKQKLQKAIDFATSFSTKVIVEEKVQNLKEINISLCGDIEKIETSVCESPLSESEFLTYEEKYMDSGSKGMAASKRIIPADIDPALEERIRKTAIEAFKSIGCAGVTRIDFLLDKGTDALYLCELNTIPGSLSYYLWEASGVSFEALLQKMLDAAMRGFRRKHALSRSTDFNLLSKENLKGIKK